MKSLKNEEDLSPDQRLFMSVITLALEDASYQGPYIKNIIYKRDAIDWIQYNGNDFKLICMMANMDPDYVHYQAKKHKLFTYTEYQSKVLFKDKQSISRNRYVINLNEDYI
jgi:thiamine monophosphate kinase